MRLWCFFRTRQLCRRHFCRNRHVHGSRENTRLPVHGQIRCMECWTNPYGARHWQIPLFQRFRERRRTCWSSRHSGSAATDCPRACTQATQERRLPFDTRRRHCEMSNEEARRAANSSRTLRTCSIKSHSLPPDPTLTSHPRNTTPSSKPQNAPPSTSKPGP